MAAPNRSALITATFKVLRKKFKPAPSPPERDLLHHWLYGCCLENARYEDADQAFQTIMETAFDLNELRRSWYPDKAWLRAKRRQGSEHDLVLTARPIMGL